MTITSIETLNIPGMPIFSYDASCIMSVPERSARIMPENIIVTNKTVEKRIAFQISWVPRILSLHDHLCPIPYVVVIVPLTHRDVFLIDIRLSPRKRKFLSEWGEHDLAKVVVVS